MRDQVRNELLSSVAATLIVRVAAAYHPAMVNNLFHAQIKTPPSTGILRGVYGTLRPVAF